jgi:FAD dependent oxidoreductase
LKFSQYKMPSKNIKKQTLNTDILIAGGGMSGVSAALAAARNGSKVILCQDRPVLGGNASSEIRMHIVGADMSGQRGIELETEARETGIIEEIRLDNCIHNPQRSPSMFDLILYDKCKNEPNLTLLLNTSVTQAEVINNVIQNVTAERVSTEDQFTINAQIFIDCTGDGRLGIEAGAPFMEGREASSDFSENLALEKADNKRLGSTLLFQAKKHDAPIPFVAPSWTRKFSEEDLKLRPHASKYLDYGLEYGYWWVEWGGHLDTISQNEEIRDELLSIVMGVWDHVKNGGDHGAEHWALEWFGFLPGKRESRRFIGHHILTQSDLFESKKFDNAIAYGGWPIDVHPPEGVDAPDIPPCTQHRLPLLYDIPLSACVSSKINNLMFAGRNISATHLAFASTRVMATCSVIGQGVGTSASYALKHGMTLPDILKNQKAINEIQQQLLKDDAYLIGIFNEDPNDLALKATWETSGSQIHQNCSELFSGQTRSLHGESGAPLSRIKKGTNRWISEPLDTEKSRIELSWENPVDIKQIQLVFDTGLHRMLTMTLADACLELMQWGKPQEETVRNYHIDYCLNNKWTNLFQIEKNHQRLRRHFVNEHQEKESVK